jgi:hypothetical protein
MTVHRIACCCTAPTAAEPRLVRAGWYHFLVMDTSGGLSCIVGKPRSVTIDYPVDLQDCEGTSSTAPACVEETVPVEAWAGHPLAVPVGDGESDLGLRTTSNPSGKTVKDITCGAYHCIVRCTDNTIRAWGLNSYGQCNVPTNAVTVMGSRGDLTDPSNPWLKRIVGLHAGYSNSAISFNDGSVFCWGDPVVANEVNNWSDISMSPVRHNPAVAGVSKYGDMDNVATDGTPTKTWYAKPEYSAAYNPDAETWNLTSDPYFQWHSEGSQQHCSPMFDLGVETDPCNPMDAWVEYSEGWLMGSWNTKRPGWPREFPGTGYVCDIDLVSDPESAEWARWLDQRWRNAAFSRNGAAYQTRKSCCDLEVKRDFAVAVRRTGQVITTRSANRKTTGDSSNPACPSGVSCRDCSADWIVSSTCMPMSNYRAGCGAPNDFCYMAECACCNPYNATSGSVGNCPDCSGQICKSQQRFRTFSSCSGLSDVWFEGVGCMASHPKFEDMLHDEEWATPWVQTFTACSAESLLPCTPTCTGGMMKRWIAGKQVKSGSVSTAVPAVNSKIGQDFGWSTLPAIDTVMPKVGAGSHCQRLHPSESACNTLCGDDALVSTYEPAPVSPDAFPQFDYPIQMRAQSVFCGSNTTVWHSQARGHGDTGFTGPECNGCATWPAGNINCKVNFFQSLSPNGGEVTYGCIYTGDSIIGGPLQTKGSRDKYNETNNLLYANGTVCSSSVTMYALANHTFPSKAWGPMHFVMWNSVGDEKSNLYPTCHCCASLGGDDPIRLPPPKLLQVRGAWPELDSALGTRYGFPPEVNMHCNGNYDEAYGCAAVCGSVYPDVGEYQPSVHSFPFCVNQLAQSYASSRMAFAMVRADHRDCARDASGDCMVDANGDTIRSEPTGLCGKYPPPSNDAAPNYSHDHTQFTGCTDGQENGADPVIRTERMLHIWGSLWDPCSPFPRLCDCMETNPDTNEVPPLDWPFSVDYSQFTPLFSQSYSAPCYALHPENVGVPPELDDAHADYGKPHYPAWTRRASVSRVASKGAWVSGVWTVADATEYEATVAAARYCPDCDNWTQQYDGDQ